MPLFLPIRSRSGCALGRQVWLQYFMRHHGTHVIPLENTDTTLQILLWYAMIYLHSTHIIPLWHPLIGEAWILEATKELRGGLLQLGKPKSHPPSDLFGSMASLQNLNLAFLPTS